MQIQTLGQEDPLEEERAPHPSIFAWRIPLTEETGRVQSWGLKGSDTTERLITAHLLLNLVLKGVYFSIFVIINLEHIKYKIWFKFCSQNLR